MNGRERRDREARSHEWPFRALRRNVHGHRLRQAALALALVLPSLTLLAIFRGWPLVEAARLSLTSWDGFSEPVAVGLRNYQELVSDPTFRIALTNNLKILLALPVWVLLPLLIAQALHARVPGWRFFRFVFFLPAVLSPVVLGVYYGLALRLDGPVNATLRKLQLGTWARDWLNDPEFAFAIVTAVLMWSTFGLGVLIYLAGLSTLDDEILEAARVDGASPLQVERHIIVFLMMPVIRFWSLIIFIAAFTGVFPLIFSLTRGGPGYATYMIEFDIYQEAFNNGALGYSSAIGMVLLAFVATLIAVLSRVLRDRVG